MEFAWPVVTKPRYEFLLLRVPSEPCADLPKLSATVFNPLTSRSVAFSILEEMAARLSAPTISFVSGAMQSISSRLVSFLFKLLHGGNGMENSNFFQKRSPPAHVETGKLSLEIEVHRDLSQHILHILTPDLSLQRHENIARGLRAMA